MQANLEKKKILDPRNAEEHQSFLRKKNRKSVKQSDIITYKPKTFENPSNVDIKSVITEYSKNLHKLSKTIRKSEKLGSNSSLYSDTNKKFENVLNEKNIKVAQREHAFKSYARTRNVEILNYFHL